MKRIITTPIKDKDIADLRIGNIIYLSGTLATGRDDVHRRIVQEGMQSPFDFNGLAIFHAGPIIKEENNRYKVISIGPTSSIRMEAWAADFIEKTGVKIMIGKGAMGEKTAAACRKHHVIHCVYPGGCAVLGAEQVSAVKTVFWQELGMPEAMWILQVKELGPLIISIDTQGENIFAKNNVINN